MKSALGVVLQAFPTLRPILKQNEEEYLELSRALFAEQIAFYSIIECLLRSIDQPESKIGRLLEGEGWDDGDLHEALAVVLTSKTSMETFKEAETMLQGSLRMNILIPELILGDYEQNLRKFLDIIKN
ncbi:MAG: hypothetical protein M1834_007037 [Cirrosporium novae-zelandiae]|nr:MAG: hypothetical protein M1834_007037 [Cirrosporium novae-zelandiae]